MCEHLTSMPIDPMPPGGCGPCLAAGDRWVHLRYCTECHGTFCCDDSPNQHSRRHYHEVGHPVMRSKEPGEDWAWCYADHEAREPVVGA